MRRRFHFALFLGLHCKLNHPTMMDDDDFGEGIDDRYMVEANLRKIADKLGKDGFRIGKSVEEERQMQIGFDEGFSRGTRLGQMCGSLYGQACVAAEVSKSQERVKLLTELEILLFDTIPENEEIDAASVSMIESLLLQLSPNLVADIDKFKSAVAAMS